MHNFKNGIRAIACGLVVVLLIKGLDIILYPCTFVRNNIHTMITEQKDVLVLGTSEGMSDLDTDTFLNGTGLTGQNMCVGGEYPIDAYYLTKLAIEKQNPKTVIYVVSPGYLTTEKEKGNNYLLFYHEFPISALKLEYFSDAMLDSDIRFPLFSFHEYSLETEIPRIKDNIYQKLTDNYDVSYLKGETQEYHEDGFVEKYSVEEENFPTYTPVLFEKGNVKQTNIDYLDKLIRLCKDNDIEFIATSLPLAATKLVEEEDNYREAWDYLLEYFRDQDVEYYNFNREYYQSFSHGLENYVDYNGHMNGDSARAFSKVFGETVFSSEAK